MINKETAVACALYSIPGMGSMTLRKLYGQTGSMEEVLKLPEENFRGKSGEVFLQVKKEFKENPEEMLKRMGTLLESYETRGIHFVFCGEENYPNRLKQIPDYPFGLFYMGRLPSETEPTVSVIGARECSEYGRKVSELFGTTLAGYGVQIISGMARGVDGITQSAALRAGGSSFGILGSGVDICYPRENAELYENLKIKGGVISEFLPGTAAKSNFFPMRNRIISALADILLVVEARSKSGTYITVCQALEQGKEIYAVPGRITDGLSDGCNRLIAQGAGVASDPSNLLDALECMDRRLYEVEKERGRASGSEKSPGTDTESSREMILTTKRSTGSKTEGESGKDFRKESGMESGKLSVRPAILRVLEDTLLPAEEILDTVRRLGIDMSYTDLICELTELCLDGRAEGVGNYFKKL